ncbi:hypothetical protein AYI70_g3276 [Smittium culicis]|uniref:Uncharacterized protein n=1 Tax=Smittium culicis TaxID=133412 RepID=A0A1R1Y4C6_9FUNG|nr:hypothetical protein AYI70_g3276 [Smittium culicis]
MNTDNQMPQSTETQIEVMIRAINALTAKVGNLTVERATEPTAEEDQHITANVPATVLNAYLELEKLIPSMSDNFYRTLLTKEEKREAIYACPKSSNVSYNPPPLNDSTSSADKKADSALYAIQTALAHGTRPIDYFIHRLLQADPTLTLEDPVVDILNTLRCVMGNIAAMETQSRLDNLHTGMNFTGKPDQIVESDVKPLMDSEKFEAQLVASKTARRPRTALAHGTRPIDYFIHRLLQADPTLTLEDPVVDILNTLRCVMGNIAAMETQSRLDNLHTGMNFTGKPDQIVESDVKPLMDSEKFEAQLVASKTARRPRVRKPFRGRQQAGTQNSTYSKPATAQNPEAATPSAPTNNHPQQTRVRPPGRGVTRYDQIGVGQAHRQPMGSEHSYTGIQNPIQESSPRESDSHEPEILARPPTDVTPAAERKEANQGGERYPNEGSISAVGEARDRGGSATDTGLLQPTIYDSEEDWRPPPRPRPEKPQSKRRGAEFQDGDPIIHLPHGPPERLPNFSGPTGRLYAHFNIQEVQEIPQAPMERPVISVQGPSFWAVTQPPDIYEDSTAGSRMGQIQGYTNFGIPRRPVDPGRDQGYLQIQHASDQGSTQGIQQIVERWTDYIERTLELHWKGSSNVNCPTPGEAHAAPSVRVEESVTHQDEFMDVDCCLNDTSIPESIILEELTEIMERSLVLARNPGIRNIHGFQRFGLGNSSGVSLLLGNMVPLRGVDAHQRQGAENSSVCTKTQERDGQISPCLLRQHDDYSIREEVWGHHITQTSGNIRGNLGTLPEDEHQAPGNLRTFSFEPRRRPEQTDCTNRMVVIPRDIRNTERTSWSPRRGSVCFPPEQEGGSLLQLVPGPQGCGSELTSAQLVGLDQHTLLPTLELNSTGSSETTQGENSYDSRNYFVEISHLVSGSEDIVDMPTVSTSRNDGLGTHAFYCILSNERRVKRRSRHNSIQQRFLDWRISYEITTPISAAQIRNYLAELYSKEKRKVGTIRVYKSAILMLADDPKELASHPMLDEFIKALDASAIRSFVKPTIDISPILDKFRWWGPTSDLSIKDLTAKLCWLFAVAGFLRASDIHRIDDARSRVDQGILYLVIVAPKEKREGRPIEKPCQISPHSDPILCLVVAYTIYKEKVARKLCPTLHAKNSMWTVNRLVKFVNDSEKPLSVDIITRYIHKISTLIGHGPDAPIPKGREIGATLAANSGVSSDEIVAHAFWSNYSIFDTYYRLKRNSSNNLTESIL